MRAKSRRPATVGAVVAVIAGLAATALRFLSTNGLSNDHFVGLTRAVQMLYGDWPVRDFVDPGLPLMYGASAVVQGVFGRTLLSEALLVAVAFGLSAALTVWVVQRWCGSLLLGLWAAFAGFAVFPRSYSYPKILLYVWAAMAFLAYVQRPSVRRAAGLAALTVVAFLFRHDHGLFIGAATLVLVFAAGLEHGSRSAVTRVLLVLACTAALAAPYLLFIQLNGGLDMYVGSAMAFSAVEAQRTTLDGWPGPGPGVPWWSDVTLSALSYYVLWALPMLALVFLLCRRRILSWSQRGLVLAVAALAVSANAGFLRDPLTARAPDAFAPAVLLMAWLSHQLWQLMQERPVAVAAPVRAVVVAGLLVAALASAEIGRFAEKIDRAAADRGIAKMRERWVQVSGELSERFNERQMPADLDAALIPFFAYVDACTAPDDRLLVTGFAPEVPYYARRAFAGGQVTLFGGYYVSVADQHLQVRRLEQQSVPLVVVPPESHAELPRNFPIVQAWVDDAYTLMAEIAVEGQDDPARIYIRRDLAGRPAYEGRGWPCGDPQRAE